MNTTLLQTGRTIAPACELVQFQRKVFRVVADIIVHDQDGQKMCHLQSTAMFDGKPLATIQELILGFIGEWKSLFNSLMSQVRANCFGHLEPNQINLLDIVASTGTQLLGATQALHRIEHRDKSPDLANHILDMREAVQSMKVLQLSYEINPENTALDALAIAF